MLSTRLNRVYGGAHMPGDEEEEALKLREVDVAVVDRTLSLPRFEGASQTSTGLLVDQTIALSAVQASQ